MVGGPLLARCLPPSVPYLAPAPTCAPAARFVLSSACGPGYSTASAFSDISAPPPAQLAAPLPGMALSNRLGYLAINHAPRLCGSVMAAGGRLLRAAGALGLGPVAAAARQAAVAGEEAREEDQQAGASGEGDARDGRVGAGGPDGGTGGGPAGGGPHGATARADEAAAPLVGPLTAAAAGDGGAVRRGAALRQAVTAALLMAVGFSRADRWAEIVALGLASVRVGC
jgi:hypothetical protein